jgi:molecular chaperone DnaK
MEVTRRQLESAIGSLLETTIELAKRAVQDAKLPPSGLTRICLVGGSTRIPLVRKLLKEAFEVPIHDEIDADLAVGLGASIQAGMLQGASVDRILVDVAAHSLGVRVLSDEDELRGEADTFAPLIPRNSVLPSLRRDEFYTLRGEQEYVQIEVFQGESSRASENARVGEFQFPLEPQPDHSPVQVEFAYDLNGVVKVSVSQPGTENRKTVALAVADAGKEIQRHSAPADTAVVRKARALIEQLEPARKAELEVLLLEHAAAEGAPARERVEEALLDFFLEHESA